MQKSGSANYKIGLYLLGVLSAGILAVLGYYFRDTWQTLGLTREELSLARAEIIELEGEVKTLATDLETERYKNSLFGGQISEIASTVGTLDKLSKTDKELLQKYSKVYFLNEHYVPDDLTALPSDYLFEKGRNIQVHSKVFPYLQSLFVAAVKDGIDLRAVSGYRSFGEQSALKAGYTVSYGSGANKFSADQGYSEHQLGTTLDFTTPESGVNFNGFKNTAAYKWLTENAYKYGFVLSYPENNSYYQFEPWHWRFVGKALANMMREEKQNFYDLPQNKIDAYLLKIFD